MATVVTQLNLGSFNIDQPNRLDHGKIPLRQDCLAHAAAETEPLQAALKRPGAEQSQAGWNIFLPSGKQTWLLKIAIETVIFHSFLYVYQRVDPTRKYHGQTGG